MKTPDAWPAVARSSQSHGQPLAALLSLLIAQMRASRSRRHVRRELLRLLESDLRMLDDIGVTRDAVFRELDRL